MDAERKKQIKNDYKSKLSLGAVYCIECSGNGRRLIKSTPDIGGLKNRFGFAQSIRSCPDPALLSEWSKYGNESFSLVVLEEMEQKKDQSCREFAEDMRLLQELWLEKAKSGNGE